MDLGAIPEIAGLEAHQGLVRIPQEIDVPLTPRVRALVDTPEFRRLAHISQLGLVSLVYPAAHHRRFEHSLGVYRLCLQYIRQLSLESRFQERIERQDVERLIVAALLHDIGHWPFCHLIEDMQLSQIPRHEDLAHSFLTSGRLAEVLWQQWKIRGEEIAELLANGATDPGQRILQSILSGPIDIDKMDYLMRDSLHAGVPYGRNFDQARLISSMCLNEAGDGLALTEKGRTAAEMMVFARYVMFSEVYWHHAVRSATAMLQRAFFQLLDQLDLAPLFRLTEQPFIDHLRAEADPRTAELLHGLFGPERRLYKRWAQYSLFERPELYGRLARQPYPWLARCSTELAQELSSRLQRPVESHHVLIDAPPRKLEVQFDVEIFDPKRNQYRRLGDVSPVVRTLAETQFDDYVKRVRVFIHPALATEARRLSDTDTLLEKAIEATGRYITGAVRRSADSSN